MERNEYFRGKLLHSSDFEGEQEYLKDEQKPGEGGKSHMATGSRTDPYKNFNFLVEIDGITVAGFTECTGLESETEAIEYREGNEANIVRKLAGLTKYANITLKRGVTDNKELYNWRKATIDGNIERKNGSIILLNDRREEVARWNFRQGWPCYMGEPDLNAMESEIAIETLEICHEGFERE
jgi:phage tail-like protein